MRLSLSVRVAESFSNKRVGAIPLQELAPLARNAGYEALCMRASVCGVQHDRDEVATVRAHATAHDLAISMVTADFDVPENKEAGPRSLRDITPSLDLAEALGSDLIRVCLKTEEDIKEAASAADEAAERGLLKAFFDISPDVGKKGVALSIEGREINTRYCGDGVVWFEFEMICDGPRSQNDYIELAHVFQTVLIGNVPVFTESDDGQARRFISLVDEFYDRNVKLIVSAEAGITDLYQGYRLAFEFQRTESRLKEMQSSDYLRREHRP